MKNCHKGFAAVLAVILVALLAAGGTYVYFHKHQNTSPNMNEWVSTDLGAIPVNENVRATVIVQSKDTSAALQKAIQEMYDPSSPMYHKYLTPEQFREKFGTPTADKDAVILWLNSRGFVATTTNINFQVVFSGPASAFKQVFNVDLEKYNVAGDMTGGFVSTDPNVHQTPTHYSFECDVIKGFGTQDDKGLTLSIPSDLAGKVKNISLNTCNFPPIPG